MRAGDHALLLLVAPPAFVQTAMPARSAQYLSIEQAQRALFADADRFEPVPVALSESDRDSIEKIAGTRTLLPVDRIWRATRRCSVT